MNFLLREFHADPSLDSASPVCQQHLGSKADSLTRDTTGFFTCFAGFFSCFAGFFSCSAGPLSSAEPGFRRGCLDKNTCRFLLNLLAVAMWLTLLPGCGDSELPKEKASSKKIDFTKLIEEAQITDVASGVESNFSFTTMDQSGVDFVHQSGNSEFRPFPAANGSGVGVIDFDLDGWPDLFFANGTTFPLDPQNTKFTDALYRNLGDFRFQNVSQITQTDHAGYSAGVAVGDFDSDGFADLYVSCFGANQLYHNQGDGTFLEITSPSGTQNDQWGTSAVFFDYDSDGLLDLYVGNYAIWNFEELNKECFSNDRSERIFCSPLSVEPAPDALLHNQGDGTFVDASQSTGIAQRKSRTQGVLAGDFDNNGTTDLYLGNDMHANSFFVNDGLGRFDDRTDSSGMGYDATGRSQAGMGLASADVDSDGSMEVFVTNYANEHNAFYRLIRKDAYADSSDRWGLSADSLNWVGWGTAFVDFDLDRKPDLVVTNGHTDHNKPNEAYQQPALIWKNQDDRFQKVDNRCGPYFQSPHVGRGLAYADLDNDGDWDLIFAHLNQPAAILRNDTPHAPAWRIQLEGRSVSRDAIGTRVKAQWQNGTAYFQVTGGGSYLSYHDLRVIIPGDDQPVKLTIDWLNQGQTQIELQPDQRDQTIIIRQPSSVAPNAISAPETQSRIP